MGLMGNEGSKDILWEFMSKEDFYPGTGTSLFIEMLSFIHEQKEVFSSFLASLEKL